MKAARWYKAGDIRVEDVPECQIDEDYDVKVKLHWCGICGSDLHEYLMGPIFIPVGEPHPVTGEAAPVIMGHEFSGEVVEVGEFCNACDVCNVVGFVENVGEHVGRASNFELFGGGIVFIFFGE